MTQSYISFPKLNLTFNVDSVAFTIGSKDVYWYGIIIALGFLAAIAVAVFLAKKSNLEPEIIYDIVIFGTPAAIICARLYYVAFEWSYYSENWGEIVKIWNGGIAIYGAIIGAVVSTTVYCRVKKKNLPLVCDIGAVGLVVGQIFGRWGNFFNQEAFGGNTTLPWGMTGDVIAKKITEMAADGINADPAMPVHPTFLYESLWNLCLLLILLLIFKRKKFDGQIFLIYVAGYGLGRFLIEGLRTDSLYIGIFRVSQIVAVCSATVACAAIIYKFFKIKEKDTKTIEIFEKK